MFSRLNFIKREKRCLVKEEAGVWHESVSGAGFDSIDPWQGGNTRVKYG